MYAVSQSLLLTHSLLRLLTSKLLISLNSIPEGTKTSEYSIVFGGMAKGKPLDRTFRDHLRYSFKN